VQRGRLRCALDVTDPQERFPRETPCGPCQARLLPHISRAVDGESGKASRAWY
jgi:hypothetical protein